MNAVKGFAALLVLLAAGAAVLVGLYQGGWWLKEDAVNRTSSINNDSYARQTALQEELIDKYRTVSDIDVQLTTATAEQEPALKAQRQAVLNQFCLAHAQFTNTTTIPDYVLDYADRNCA